MLTAALAAITSAQVILFGKYNKTFCAVVEIAFFKLRHILLFFAGQRYRRPGLWPAKQPEVGCLRAKVQGRFAPTNPGLVLRVA